MRLKSVFPPFLMSFAVAAEEAQVLDVRMEDRGSYWSVRAVVHHPDTGWEHYLDAWRVTTEQGNVISMHIIEEPRTGESSFALTKNVVIPRYINTIMVEARDTKNGWSSQRVRVDLTQREGARYRVVR